MLMFIYSQAAAIFGTFPKPSVLEQLQGTGG